MLAGIGLDLIEIHRIKALHEKEGEKFINRVFTYNEQKYFFKKKNPYPSMAARFAAKEAAFKALNLRDKGASWREIYITTLPDGRPSLCLRGKAAKWARKQGVRKIFVSLTHNKDTAAASVSVVK